MPKRYIRKTRDEWEIQSWTGRQYGWEVESTYDDRKEALEDLKVYRRPILVVWPEGVIRVESPYPCRLVKRRVRVEGMEGMEGDKRG